MAQFNQLNKYIIGFFFLCVCVCVRLLALSLLPFSPQTAVINKSFSVAVTATDGAETVLFHWFK